MAWLPAASWRQSRLPQTGPVRLVRDLSGGSRRVGGVHALSNTTALVLHALSWAAPKAGQPTSGVALSALGYAVVAFSAWLGGHLSFALGAGVNQTAFEDVPEQWTAVLGEDGLEEGKLTGAQADGVPRAAGAQERRAPVRAHRPLLAPRLLAARGQVERRRGRLSLPRQHLPP